MEEVMVIEEEIVRERRLQVKVNRETFAWALGFPHAKVVAILPGDDDEHLYVNIMQQLGA